MLKYRQLLVSKVTKGEACFCVVNVHRSFYGIKLHKTQFVLNGCITDGCTSTVYLMSVFVFISWAGDEKIFIEV